VTITTRPASRPAGPEGSAYALPNNCYGAHLLVTDGQTGTRGDKHLRWARHLVGRWGYAKTLFHGIDAGTRHAADGWIDYVSRCYQLELVPVIRLGGHMQGGQWVPPKPDKSGDYSSIAAAIQRVVSDLPRSDLCPLYVEIWNEPNLAVEWQGRPDPQAYADFFVQAAAAVRAIGDKRIRVLNGGLATDIAWTRKLCEANPAFATSFDVWASHPYPQNHPPSVNFHDKTAPDRSSLTIDSYLLEFDVLREFGRSDLKVMLTETGHDLGNSTYLKSGYPMIDEYNRADYMVRAFRDCWTRWPEVLAVMPFELCNEGWTHLDWVYPESESNPDGSPTRPHYQYSAVAALAKPTDTTGAINGTIRIARLGSRMEGAKVVVRFVKQGSISDPMGNYFLTRLPPEKYDVTISKTGFAPVQKRLTVQAGRNTVFDAEMVAEQLSTLTGTVRSGDDGRPLRGVKVSLSPGNQHATTDHQGRYEIPKCIPARYTVSAEGPELNRYEASGIEITTRRSNEHDFVLGRRKGPQVDNLVTNGGFEAGGGGGGKPGIALGFEPLVPALQQFKDGTTAVSDRAAHSGRWSQEIRLRLGEIAVRQITTYNTARPGAQYVGGAWVRVSSEDSKAGAWISLMATRNDGGVIAQALSRPLNGKSAEGWAWVTVSLVAPPGSERVSLGLHARGQRGSAWFDDAELYTTQAAPARR
jgi:hypothetical protein